jgi:hypothetical protein
VCVRILTPRSRTVEIRRLQRTVNHNGPKTADDSLSPALYSRTADLHGGSFARSLSGGGQPRPGENGRNIAVIASGNCTHQRDDLDPRRSQGKGILVSGSRIGKGPRGVSPGNGRITATPPTEDDPSGPDTVTGISEWRRALSHHSNDLPCHAVHAVHASWTENPPMPPWRSQLASGMMSHTREESEHRYTLFSLTSHRPTICSPPPPPPSLDGNEPNTHGAFFPFWNHSKGIESIQFNSTDLLPPPPGIRMPPPNPPSTMGSCTGYRIRSGVTLVFCTVMVRGSRDIRRTSWTGAIPLNGPRDAMMTSPATFVAQRDRSEMCITHYSFRLVAAQYPT